MVTVQPIKLLLLSCGVKKCLGAGSESPGAENGNANDFTNKLLHMAWHPTENSIACAAANSLYMYYA